MIDLIPHNLHWLKNVPSEYDLCVHGGFTLSGDNRMFIDASGEELNLSAAVIFLLRTIERDHSFGYKLCDKIIPECADITMVQGTDKDVEIITCPFGIDWWVEHNDGYVTLIFEDGSEIKTELNYYIRAILHFADIIKSFYENSKPKIFYNDEDRRGFDTFWKEWARRTDYAKKIFSK